MKHTNSLKKIMVLFFTISLLNNCGPGNFDTYSASSSENSPLNDPSPENPDDPFITTPERKKELQSLIEKTNMTGYVSEGYAVNNSVPTINFNKSTGELYLRIHMTHFTNLVAFEMEVKKYPGIKVIAETISSLPYITVVIPIKYIVRDVTEVTARLPNGETPYFPSGEAPSKAFVLTPNKSERIYLYMNAEAIGIFAETKFDPTQLGDVSLNKLIFSIKNKEKTKIMGYVSLIPATNNTKGGFFTSYRLDPNLSRILAEYYLN